MTIPVIETFNLAKNYTVSSLSSKPWFGLHKNLIKALVDINLKIYEGECFFITGPNGAGKTTLLRTLCGLLKPSAGAVRILGRDPLITKLDLGIACFPENSFFAELTLKENLNFFAALYKLSSEEITAKISFLSDYFEVRDELAKPFKLLSSGFKQRAALIRSLLTNGKIIFLDEPLKTLDDRLAQKFNWLLTELNQREKKTIFYITPKLEAISAMAQRFGVMVKGELKVFETLNTAKQYQETISK